MGVGRACAGGTNDVGMGCVKGIWRWHVSAWRTTMGDCMRMLRHVHTHGMGKLSLSLSLSLCE